MSKKAQRYLEIDDWMVTERGFHPDRAEVSESLFAVGNEFMGVRGYFEEGYSGPGMVGSYFNGIFTEKPVSNYFKGLVRRTHFIINAVDWLYTRLTLDGEQLDLAKSRFAEFVRTLDLQTGVMRREFVWTTRRGKQLRVAFARFTSMADSHLGAQRIELTPLNFTGRVGVEVGLDADTVCYTRDNRNFFTTVNARRMAGNGLALLAQVAGSGHRVLATLRLATELPVRRRMVKRPKYVGFRLDVPVAAGQTARLDRLVVCTTEKNPRRPDAEVWRRGLAAAQARAAVTWDTALAAHTGYWTDVWAKADVAIDGDPADQQGLRFSIFHLHQTYHGADPANNVTAKGLTSEYYWGVTWWDTETYCLPFYLFNNPAAARNLLRYRYRTLPGACERARQKDCEGARYPMCTIDGSEACTTWQHGDLEIHVSAAVAYGIWHYVHVTGDREFLDREGLEMLLQISRYYASRGAWSPRTGEYGFWFVMGADEFHMGVNNNCYTNVMAKKSFEWTLAAARDLQRRDPARWQALARKVKLRPGELADWRRKAARMRILQDKKTGLFEQHDGYFDAPHLDCRKIPATDFPLYHHWAYFRIFRWDMIKQPDVLLLPFFFSHEYSRRVKEVNYDYYEPRCSHESSLSPSIHSILAAELGRHRQAYAYWQHAARLDLDDYNRNTREGLHTTAMAAAWLNFVYGFGGLRSDGPRLSFNPSIPARWRAFQFQIIYRGNVLKVRVSRRSVTLQLMQGNALTVDLFGRPVRVTAAGITRPLPADRRG